MRSADWDCAPCGLLVCRSDGSVRSANRTLLAWLGRREDEVVGALLGELLTVGGRIYWETHLSPLLHVEGRAEEIAVELRTADGRLPVLLSAVREGDLLHVSVAPARERLRYEQELLGARHAADSSAARLQALQETTAALSRAVGVEAVADALRTAGEGPLGGAAAAVWLVRGGALAPVREPAPGLELPGTRALLQERVAVQDGGQVVVPLHGATALRGVLCVLPRTAAAADPLDLELLTAVGQHAGLALDRAGLYEQSASVARELQHSLLAVDPPDDRRFAVATAYRPGVELLEVGGDWYDVFARDADRLCVVVGDVVGRGLRAASAMGQLRSAVRAVVDADTAPGTLLSRLDGFVDQVEAASMATVAYADLDLETGLLRYACAGHPPLLLVPASGPVRLLWDGRSTPLGCYGRPERRPSAELQLAPGDRLLLCTDGLFERRDRDLDAGLELLADVVAGLRDLPLEHAVAELTRRLLVDEVVRDDVCVLMLSWPGRPFDAALPADLSTLAEVRRDLRTWLRSSGADDETAEDVVLAASEVIANAAEHGSGRQAAATVELRARCEQRADEPDRVVVRVHDGGQWREPVPSDERGRGLLIVRSLVDDVEVARGDGTTVHLRRRLGRRAS